MTMKSSLLKLTGVSSLAIAVAALPGVIRARDDTTVQAGAHVVYSYPGTTLPSELIDLAQQGQVGGVILFGENVDDSTPGQIEDLQNAYAQSSAYLGYPLLIVTDQEGGEVVRLPGGPTQSEKDIGESPNPASAASAAGTTAATACSNYNVNGNLAPILDVFRKAGDFDDQYQRSYSMNQSIVSEAAAAFITAQQAHGVVATAKHFPGLGAAAANQDTDAEPVTLNVSLANLRAIDEYPYIAAIATGLDMVMPSWAVYPALDTKPSGLSSKIIGGELRDRLGFKGVTCSDAIEAGALQAYGTNQTRSISAMNAGMDIILASIRDYTQGKDIVAAIISALGDGTLNVDEFNASTDRVMTLRSKL